MPTTAASGWRITERTEWHVTEEKANRRIDRILRPAYVEGLAELTLSDLRERRDECRGELEYLSFLRRQVQGRGEILKAELERRHSHEDDGSLIDRLAQILTPEGDAPSRGGAVQVHAPLDERPGRRRVERLVDDAAISDPGSLDDTRLQEAVEALIAEEHKVSSDRSSVIAALDILQDELKRRYKEDVSQVLS
jgi:hypothetical protein